MYVSSYGLLDQLRLIFLIRRFCDRINKLECIEKVGSVFLRERVIYANFKNWKSPNLLTGKMLRIVGFCIGNSLAWLGAWQIEVERQEDDSTSNRVTNLNWTFPYHRFICKSLFMKFHLSSARDMFIGPSKHYRSISKRYFTFYNVIFSGWTCRIFGLPIAHYKCEVLLSWKIRRQLVNLRALM